METPFCRQEKLASSLCYHKGFTIYRTQRKEATLSPKPPPVKETKEISAWSPRFKFTGDIKLQISRNIMFLFFKNILMFYMYTQKKVCTYIPKCKLWLSFRDVEVEDFYFCFLILFYLYKIYMLFLFNCEL